MPLRIVFCGTPSFAVPALRALAAHSDFKIEAVIAQPDRPSGRGGQISVPAVKAAALELGLPIFQPEKIKSEDGFQHIQRIGPDLVVIIAYGQIISARLIAIPRLGWVNVHASLLPKYRGAAPINWAIVSGETRTGVTTMQIDPGLDTGPMLLKREVDIDPDETAPELAARLAEAGAPLITETLRGLAAGELKATPQDSTQASFAPILKKEDGHIDWQLPSLTLYNRIRGFDPWPGAFTLFRGKHCQVWGRPAAEGEAPAQDAPGRIFKRDKDFFAVCGEGTLLRLEFLQLEGRKRVTAAEFANGARLEPEERFGA